ncbi:unnamed protein product [Blepharisma stoltei]|uniref:Enoyl reductase (ER) domain-containing protein n=1 Tax=Blepharisma stoltei TaxID=1481888 RepID=A0AAU9JP17_9CILI|nr:unnamed protein product [Blepharisma stoltei]
MVKNTYETLGDRAPKPCAIGDAHGVAMAFTEPGTTVTPFPFQHPELLDNEIRIHVTHAGLCHSDIFVSTLGWGENVNFPLVPGHEIVGVVEKVGERVSRFHVGDRVGFGVWRECCEQYESCRECRNGFDNLCPKAKLTYDPYFGGYATSFQAHASHFYKISDDFPGQAAPLFCAGLTVFSPLNTHMRAGMKVGVVGVGGLGHLGLKFARAMGAEVTAISTNPHKIEEAKSFGAHHFLNSRDEQQMKEAANSFDFILDTAIQINIDQDCKLIKPRGILNIVGLPDARENLNFNLFTILGKNINLTANPVGSRWEGDQMLEFCRVHDVYPLVEEYKFADCQAAVNSLAHGVPHYPKFRNVMETASFMETFTPSK